MSPGALVRETPVLLLDEPTTGIQAPNRGVSNHTFDSTRFEKKKKNKHVSGGASILIMESTILPCEGWQSPIRSSLEKKQVLLSFLIHKTDRCYVALK